MEHSIYLDGIKNALKARGVSYLDLASRLMMSESGIKKMLNAKDISFRRVLQICQVLEISPGELFSVAEKTFIPTVRLSEDQEAALIKNRDLLMVYWRFTVEKMSPLSIQKSHKLSDTEINRLLQKLVTLELIAQRKGKFLPLHQGKFRWPEDSRLARILNEEWSILTLKKTLKIQDSRNHRLVAVKLSQTSYQEILSQISEVLDRAVQQSERESLMSTDQRLQDVTLVFAGLNESVFTAPTQSAFQ